MIEKLYTVEEVAELASVTGRTIRNYLKSGRLVGRKIGGQWRFPEAEVQRLLTGGEREDDEPTLPEEQEVAAPASAEDTSAVSFAAESGEDTSSSDAYSAPSGYVPPAPLPQPTPPPVQPQREPSYPAALAVESLPPETSDTVESPAAPPFAYEQPAVAPPLQEPPVPPATARPAPAPAPAKPASREYFDYNNISINQPVPPVAEPVPKPAPAPAPAAPPAYSQNAPYAAQPPSAAGSTIQNPLYATQPPKPETPIAAQAAPPATPEPAAPPPATQAPVAQPYPPSYSAPVAASPVEQTPPPAPAYGAQVTLQAPPAQTPPVAPAQSQTYGTAMTAPPPSYYQPLYGQSIQPPAYPGFYQAPLVPAATAPSPPASAPPPDAMPVSVKAPPAAQLTIQETPASAPAVADQKAEAAAPESSTQPLLQDTPTLSDVGKRVTKFISEVHDCSHGPLICAVIDMHQSLSAARQTSERLSEIAEQESDTGVLCQSFVEFDERFYIARYTLIGNSSFLFRSIKLIG